MTNSDRLQEIRERVAESHDYFFNTLVANQAVDDRKWLLKYADERLRVNVGLLDENTELKRILGPQWKDKLQQARKQTGDPGSAFGTPGIPD